MSDTAILNEPRKGDIVDEKYELTKELGRGGFGVVFQAKHLMLADEFAIKFYLPKGKMHGQKEKERFLREGRALRRIKSEYCVHVSDMGYFFKYHGGDSVPYIVMEYLDGTDLNDHARKNHPLAVAIGIDFILQSCIALAKAHAMNIIHRDIKPSNLFLTKQDGMDRVRVIDFGLARDASTDLARPAGRLTESIDFIGTPLYMAPEQWGGLANATHLTDIFALGASLYFLLAQREPFEGNGVATVNHKIFNQPPSPLRSFRPDVPQELVDVIERALQKKQEDRYPSIVEFARALVPFGDNRAVQRLEDIYRAAEAGKGLVEEKEDAMETIPIPRPNPFVDATKKLMAPSPSQGGTVRIDVPRQSNTRVIVGVTVGAIVIGTIAGMLSSRYVSASSQPPPEPAPFASVTSAEPTPINSVLPSATAATPPTQSVSPPAPESSKLKQPSTSKPEPTSSGKKPPCKGDECKF